MTAVIHPVAVDPPTDPARAESEPVTATLAVRVPAAARDLATVILATLAVIFALEWAQSFVISLLLGILFAYTLNPLVAWLERIRIPRVAGTLIVMVGVVCAIALGTYSLRDQVQTILDQLPTAVSKLSASLAASPRGEATTLQKVQTAASEIEKATSQAPDTTPAPRKPVTVVVVDAPHFKIGNYLWANSGGVAGMIGQGAMVIFLTLFLLISGDTFKRKLVRLAGPSLSNRKITVRVLDDINHSIQRYMLMLLATNLLLALLTWITMRLIGLENAGVWAVTAGLLHIIPYLGPIVTAAGIGLAAFVQFDSVSTGLLVAAASMVIAMVVGTFVTTWMTGRIARMNTVAVFVALLFWGWLWGIWGMLLSVPITAIIKVVAQRVDRLEHVAELLGD